MLDQPGQELERFEGDLAAARAPVRTFEADVDQGRVLAVVAHAGQCDRRASQVLTRVHQPVPITGQDLHVVVHGEATVRPRQHVLDVVFGEQIAGSQESEDLAPEVLLDQGQVVAAMDGDANEGAVRAQAPVGGDQVWVVREIRSDFRRSCNECPLIAPTNVPK